MNTSLRPGATGFTLIELMVTISVLAILAAIAGPSFRDFFDRYRLRGAANEVISMVSLARAEAVKSGRSVRVDFGGTTSAWCVAASPAVAPSAGAPIGAAADCDCASNTCNAMGDGQVLAVAASGHPGVTATATTVAANFSFDSRLGLVVPLANHAATFNSPTGKYALQVAVNPLGQASLCTPSNKPQIPGVVSC
ncbi:GspH/FimT family pseudopilin [Lysobacter korlensis]|uniref:Type II secretion system protein H n=1 Tax=Lysobacter korlensis TaxID=553636 RepID=A0ABV6RPK3_9GAMM